MKAKETEGKAWEGESAESKEKKGEGTEKGRGSNPVGIINFDSSSHIIEAVVEPVVDVVPPDLTVSDGGRTPLHQDSVSPATVPVRDGRHSWQPCLGLRCLGN